jgi:hypothetical protein
MMSGHVGSKEYNLLGHGRVPAFPSLFCCTETVLKALIADSDCMQDSYACHACRGTSCYAGVAVLAGQDELSVCAVVNWDQDTIFWVKSSGEHLTQALAAGVSFKEVYEDVGTLSSRGAGPAGMGGSQATELGLRVLIDGSTVEIFSSSGQALSTRVYTAYGAPLALAVVATGGDAGVTGMAWEMQSIWK